LHLVDVSLLIISSILGLFLSIYIVRRRRAPGSQALSILILGASLWSLGYAFEVVATNISVKQFWEKFEYFGIVIIPLSWFTFVAQYLGNPTWMMRILRRRVLLLIIPVLTLILVWTNDYHHLLWRLAEQPGGELVTLLFEHGVWFWVLMAYNYLLLLMGSIKLAISLFSIVRLQRWQVLLALLAILFPWMGNILYLTGLSSGFILDWTAFMFLFSGVLFSVSLFRFQLVNIVPIAQEAVFAGLTDCVVVLDTNDCIVDMNPAAKNMINCPGQKALGKNISLAMPVMVSHLKQAGYEKDYIDEITQGEGQDLQYYDLHISPLTVTPAIPIGRVVVLHQITQHKRDQAELEMARDRLEMIVEQRTEELTRAFQHLQQELTQRTLAEKRFEDVIESAPDAMFLLDQAGSILLVNGMAEQLFGYPRTDLVGKNFVDSLIPNQHRLLQSQYFNQVIENPSTNHTSFGVDLFASRKDGSVFPMEMDVSRLYTANGYWMAINVHDISDRKRAESALRESEQTYRALFENAGDAIFLTDIEGRIIQGNKTATELLGFKQKELHGLSIYDITMPEDGPDVKIKMDSLLKGDRLAPYMRRYIKRSGEVLPTENYKVLVRNTDGKPKYFQTVARDITERIKAEQAQNQLVEEIRKSNEHMRHLALRLQEVEELERQKLAVELHDRVGQNLTGLNLNLKILQNQLPAESMPGVHKRLQESLIMVEETTRKIRDVMADLNPPVLDEYGFLAAIKWYGGEFSEQTGITTFVRGKKLNPRLAAGIEKILFRLVQEMLNNVAKHAQATRVVISIKADKETVSVVVKDNGRGFDPAKVKEPTVQPHWGFLSMQQRAASIGAQLVIESVISKGTQVLIKVRRNHHDN
jgi:PAS domain S-box-containing protein